MQKTVTCDTELESLFAYANLARLAKMVLVLLHSNAYPERYVGEDRDCSLLSPSTVCDLVTVKVNHDAPCYLSDDLFIDKLLQEAKSATHRSLEKNVDKGSE